MRVGTTGQVVVTKDVAKGSSWVQGLLPLVHKKASSSRETCRGMKGLKPEPV